MKRKWFQIGSGILFGVALLSYPLYSTYFHLTVEQILGLFVGFGTFCYWYFDGKMDNVVKAVEDGLKGHIGENNLAHAIGEAAKIRTHWAKVRILATSTGQIQPIFQSSGLNADTVEIIVRKIRPDEIERDPQLGEYQRDIARLTGEWLDLERKGRIKKLTICELHFFPLDYNVIFDQEVMINGLLVPEALRFSEVNVANPTLTIARTVSAKREIQKHIERFDKLIEYIGAIQHKKVGAIEVAKQ